MRFKFQIQTDLEDYLFSLGYPVQKKLILELPNNSEYGDYATNISFLLAKGLKKNPKLVAEEITQKLNQNTNFSQKFVFSFLNGFINIKIKDEFLWENFQQLFKKDKKYEKSSKKILLEYVSANPTGPLHIGHGRWAVTGNVLYSLLKFIGVEITAEFYINDMGNQIANLKKSIEAIKNDRPIPEDGYHGTYVQDLALSSADPLETIVNEQKSVLEKCGVTFDNWFSESSLHKSQEIKEVLDILEHKKISYKKEGALWFKSSLFGDEKDRVLIKADASYTYFLVDIAYHLNKINRGYNYLVNIWGADHHGYAPRLKAALKAIVEDKFKVEENFQIIIGQLVSLYRNGELVRMSKRTGDMITLADVLDEIGKDALRFFLIQKSQDTHLDFDLELAKKKTAENPVYYVQYAHARICSILRKLAEQEVKSKSKVKGQITFDSAERDLIFIVLQAYDEIYESAQTFAPYRIANYSLILAKKFHNFYERCPILKSSGDVLEKRVIIIEQLQKKLQLCLNLLGVFAPEKM